LVFCRPRPSSSGGGGDGDAFVNSLFMRRLCLFVLLKGCFVAASDILDLVSGGVIGIGLGVGLLMVSKLDLCGQAGKRCRLLQPPVRRMPVRKAVMKCSCFFLFFFI